MTGAATESDTSLRLCVIEGCETRLSRFNPSMKCAACETRIEIGGARIPLPRQPAFPPRAPAPERPTTDGGIPLPGVVPGRERSYEEMIAKPADPPRAPSNGCKVDGCTKPIVTAGGSWAYLCEAHRAEKRQQAAESAPPPADTRSGEEAGGTDVVPDPAPTGTPTTPATHGGHARKFDWADAAQRFLDGATAGEIAAHLGVTTRAVTRVVRHELGDDRARALSAERQAQGRHKPRPRARVARVAPPCDIPATPPADCRSELARLAAELDEIHNEQTRLYARWRVTAERHAELRRDAS